jgi:valyl-tRNA synthetase
LDQRSIARRNWLCRVFGESISPTTLGAAARAYFIRRAALVRVLGDGTASSSRGATDRPADTRPVYVVPMPPPNVTGSLHMGHAQRCTLEDALVRWHRMRGFNTLWQPGIDHAGIATQLVVERQLAREGKSRHDLGREAFVERVWQWRRETGAHPHSSSASSALARLVAQQVHDGPGHEPRRDRGVRAPLRAGLMYRATRLINWCPECMTSLSDLEVENEEGANGELFEFAYEVEGGGEIVVATTRPETMLGDTAVAVHPDDPRYKRSTASASSTRSSTAPSPSSPTPSSST